MSYYTKEQMNTQCGAENQESGSQNPWKKRSPGRGALLVRLFAPEFPA